MLFSPVFDVEKVLREKKNFEVTLDRRLLFRVSALEWRYDDFRDDMHPCSELAFVQVVLDVSREASETDLFSSCSVRKRQSLCCFE